MIIVSDTSSISNLLQIGLIDILHALYGEITITPAVRRELYHLPNQEKQIEQIDWIKVKTPQDQGMIVQLLEEIDLGEAESIVLAMEEQAKYLIIDEYKGRMIADSYGIKIVGILGVLMVRSMPRCSSIITLSKRIFQRCACRPELGRGAICSYLESNKPNGSWILEQRSYTSSNRSSS